MKTVGLTDQGQPWKSAIAGHEIDPVQAESEKQRLLLERFQEEVLIRKAFISRTHIEEHLLRNLSMSANASVMLCSTRGLTFQEQLSTARPQIHGLSWEG